MEIASFVYYSKLENWKLELLLNMARVDKIERFSTNSPYETLLIDIKLLPKTRGIKYVTFLRKFMALWPGFHFFVDGDGSGMDKINIEYWNSWIRDPRCKHEYLDKPQVWTTITGGDDDESDKNT